MTASPNDTVPINEGQHITIITDDLPQPDDQPD